MDCSPFFSFVLLYFIIHFLQMKSITLSKKKKKIIQKQNKENRASRVKVQLRGPRGAVPPDYTPTSSLPAQSCQLKHHLHERSFPDVPGALQPPPFGHLLSRVDIYNGTSASVLPACRTAVPTGLALAGPLVLTQPLAGCHMSSQKPEGV